MKKQFVTLILLSLNYTAQAQSTSFLISTQSTHRCEDAAISNSETENLDLAEKACEEKGATLETLELQTLSTPGTPGCWGPTTHISTSISVGEYKCLQSPSTEPFDSFACYNTCMDESDDFMTCHNSCGLW